MYRSSISANLSPDEVIVDEPWLEMRWDVEHRCVLAEWKAFATSSDFQGALRMALEVIRQRNGATFVNDTRRLELVSDEDQRWLRYTWAPLAIQMGIKRIAVVMAQHGLSKMAIEGMFAGRRNTGDRLQSRMFDSVSEALNWVAEI